jgi:hypothetical protein
MTRHRAMLSRRGRVQWWTERHPISSRALIVAASLAYLWALLGATVQR